MATQTIQSTDQSTLLRTALRINSIFSGLSGLVFAFNAPWLAQWMGTGYPMVIIAIGVGLIAYAIMLWWAAAQKTLDRRQMVSFIIGDVLWVVGSAVLLVGGWLPLTTAGWWTIAILADIVAIFAILQTVGLSRLPKGA